MQPLRIVSAAYLAAATTCLLAQFLGAAEAGNGWSAVIRPPAPQQVHSRAAPVRKDLTALVPFWTAPFPYHGNVAGTDKPFLNVNEDGRLGHRTPFGRLYWEDETYSDNRVLLHIPKGFDPKKPSVMIVFFHGHGATLTRDVLRRQRVPAQITASGVNAVLVAPQLAFDASDSSVGKFSEPGAFGRFIGEAAQALAELHGDLNTARTFASMPIVLVAYSGGYKAAAWSATRGGLIKRVRGVVLLDALYGDLDKFASWISADRSAFFVSTYLGSTEAKNAKLEQVLADRSVDIDTELEPRLEPGSVTIFPGATGSTTKVTHRDLVTRAWTYYPLADLLRRMRGYRR